MRVEVLMNYGLRDAIEMLVAEKEGKKRKEENVKVIELARSREAAGMKRREIVDRLGENWLYEEAPVHIKRKGSVSWRRGRCRRYGLKTFIFVSRDGDEKDEVLEIEKFEVKNDVEWALGAAEKRLARLEADLAEQRQNIDAVKETLGRARTTYGRFVRRKRSDLRERLAAVLDPRGKT